MAEINGGWLILLLIMTFLAGMGAGHWLSGETKA